MASDLPEDLDLDDMALSSGEEEDSDTGSEMEEEDEEEMEMTDSELQAETIGSLFYRSYHPTFMDLCTEFADSEEFLIDGDALLRQTLAKEGITKGSASLVSLHIISLLSSTTRAVGHCCNHAPWKRTLHTAQPLTVHSQ